MTIERYLREQVESTFTSPPLNKLKSMGFAIATPFIVIGLMFTSFFNGKKNKLTDYIAGIIFCSGVLYMIQRIGKDIHYVVEDVWRFPLNGLFQFVLSAVLISVLITVITILHWALSQFSEHNLRMRRLIRIYQGVQFSAEEYLEATKALTNFKPVTYREMIKKYPLRIADLLVLSESILQITSNKYQRLVSIRSILEDREAGAGDE